MPFQLRKLLPLLLTLLVFAPLSVVAQDSLEDAEQKLDDGLKDFGYLAGLSTGCVAVEQVEDLEREVLDLHGTIGRLLGTDRAFLFAAAFGYGNSMRSDAEECKDVLGRYEAMVEAFRLGKRTEP
jgi:hypothetical protein